MLTVVSPTYQPIIDLQASCVSHYEALARTPLGGASHVQLIEVGEQLGFVHLIDLAMLEHVAQFLVRERKARVAINVSVASIEMACPELLSQLFRFMDVADRLVFEITESIQVHDFARLSQFISAVRLLQGKIAIDDFGTGFFKSNDLVQRIRPEYLKLSGQIVDAAMGDRDHERLALINRDVAAFGGHVIAERIDSKAKLDFVRQAGIRYGQGFLLGVPQPFPEGMPSQRLLSACA